MHSQVNWFFNKATQWQKAYAALRTIALNCELTKEPIFNRWVVISTTHIYLLFKIVYLMCYF